MLPISIDGAVCTSSLAMFQSARLDISAPWLARGMLVLAVAATLACNVAYGLPHGWPGALLSGWPAVAFMGSAEVAISMSRRTRIIAQAEAVGSETATEAFAEPVAEVTAEPVIAAAAVRSSQRPRRRHAGKSRRGGSLAQRKATRAALEAKALTLLDAEPPIGTTELARRLDCSLSTAQRLKREIRAGQSAN